MRASEQAGPVRPLRAARGSFYVATGGLMVVLACVGFSKTYFLPVIRGEFTGTWVFHVHGALLFAWVAFFVLQIALVRCGRVSVHRTLGFAAAGLVPAVIASTLAVAVAAMRRDVAAGLGPAALAPFLGVCTAMLWFGSLVAGGLLTRRRPDVHQRLMFVASVAVIWPAAFRLRHYFPQVPRPDVYFALVLPSLLIVAAALRDRIVLRRIHWVYWTAGLGLVSEQSIEVLLFDGPAWRSLASWLAGPFL